MNNKIESIHLNSVRVKAKLFFHIIRVILLALLINTVILFLTGKSFLSVYSALWKGSFSDVYNISRSIRWAIPLVFTALAFIGSSRAGVFNCGMEGQLVVGACTAAIVGISFPNLPGPILILLCCAAAMVAGAVWSLFAGLISIYFRANVIVVTLMLNYIATLFVEYLTRYPFNEGGALAMAASTAYIGEQAFLKTMISGSQVTTSLIVALLCCVFMAFYCNYTKIGYETRIIGSNERFAYFYGVHVNREKLITFALSGAISGLGGAMETLGIYHRFVIGAINGFGFNGIVVAALARSNPLLVPIAAFFMGALTGGAISVEMFADVPKSMTDILVGLVIIFITVQPMKSSGFLKGFRKRLGTFQQAINGREPDDMKPRGD